jgi:hypothetical protein
MLGQPADQEVMTSDRMVSKPPIHQIRLGQRHIEPLAPHPVGKGLILDRERGSRLAKIVDSRQEGHRHLSLADTPSEVGRKPIPESRSKPTPEQLPGDPGRVIHMLP